MHHQTLRNCKVKRDHFEIFQGCYCGDKNLNKSNSTCLWILVNEIKEPTISSPQHHCRKHTACDIDIKSVQRFLPSSIRSRRIQRCEANQVGHVWFCTSQWHFLMRNLHEWLPYLILLEVSAICMRASCEWSFKLDISILLFSAMPDSSNIALVIDERSSSILRPQSEQIPAYKSLQWLQKHLLV